MKHTSHQEISIFSRVPLNKRLIDLRVGTSGMNFGTVKGIARQYGIEYEELGDGCIKYTAPKSRLQLFVEKLHFSSNYYSQNPH